MTREELLKLVRDRSETLKLSREDMVRATGLSPTAIHAIELGVTALNSSTTIRYVKAVQQFKDRLSLRQVVADADSVGELARA